MWGLVMRLPPDAMKHLKSGFCQWSIEDIICEPRVRIKHVCSEQLRSYHLSPGNCRALSPWEELDQPLNGLCNTCRNNTIANNESSLNDLYRSHNSKRKFASPYELRIVESEPIGVPGCGEVTAERAGRPRNWHRVRYDFHKTDLHQILHRVHKHVCTCASREVITDEYITTFLPVITHLSQPFGGVLLARSTEQYN